jgi:hypothetical protein
VINRSSAGFGPVERAGPGDLAMRAMSARASVQQQLGALLLLEAGPGFDVSVATQRLAERIHAVPRLRQRLVHPPPGAGGPVWLDDAAFDVRRHVQRARCPTPGDEQACSTSRQPSRATLCRGTAPCGRPRSSLGSPVAAWPCWS